MFQSTRPIQASTSCRSLSFQKPYVSIHEAYTGLDTVTYNEFEQKLMFQSTRPIQASTSQITSSESALDVSIHEAYTGLDVWRTFFYFCPCIVSIHEAYTGLDVSAPHPHARRLMFQSTRPIQASTFTLYILLEFY